LPCATYGTLHGDDDISSSVSLSDVRRLEGVRILYVFPDVIALTKIHEVFGKDVHFEIFREDHKPPPRNIFDGLQDD
jgi:hypothetical protein